MTRAVEALDRIAQSDDAVFAFDGNDLVILWNKRCEELLGRPAYQVLGRHCFDVMCGRDAYGNRYCCRTCPVNDQARHHPEDPVRNFSLDVNVPNGGVKRLTVSTFTIPALRSSPATLVHVLRDPSAKPSSLERDLAAAVQEKPQARGPTRPTDGELGRLTAREQEILRHMAQGLTTSKIAEALFISPVTVRNHIARILAKLDVHTKLAAVAHAYRHGLVGPETPEPTGPRGRERKSGPEQIPAPTRGARPSSRKR